jgi:hypothetical protein
MNTNDKGEKVHRLRWIVWEIFWTGCEPFGRPASQALVTRVAKEMVPECFAPEREHPAVGLLFEVIKRAAIHQLVRF